MRLHISPRPEGLADDLGSPELPGSKSHTQRAMLLAGLLPGEWWLTGAARGQDAVDLGAALEDLGAGVTWRPGGVEIVGRTGPCRIPPELNLGENGTGARALLVALAMLGERFRLDGREGLRRRPFGSVLDVLHMAGVRTTGAGLPIAVDPRGARFPDPILVAGQLTTQGASGCMLGTALAASLAARRLRHRLGLARRRLERNVQVIEPAAAGYLELTAAVLRAFGHEAEGQAHGGDLIYRIGPRRLAKGSYGVPSDPSSRTFPRVLAAMHGRDIGGILPGGGGDPHPEWLVDGDVAAILAGPEGAAAVELGDLSARPDAVPALAALAATVPHAVAMRGIPALRVKESDRIAALAAGLGALGVTVEELPDGLVVVGQLAPGEVGDAAVEVPCPEDHRMVMALSLLGTIRRGGVVVPHATAVGKSWPGFADWLDRVAMVRVVAG